MATTKRTVEEERLVNYLLGRLPEDQRGAIERQYLGDPAFLESLESVESELIEQFLDGELSGEERLAFEENYLANPGRRRKVEWMAALIDRLRSRSRRLRAALMYSVAAGLLAMSVTSTMLYNRNRIPSPTVLHSGGAVRSLEGSGLQRIVLPPQAPILRLRLDLSGIDSALVDHASLRTVEEESPVWSERIEANGYQAFLEVFIQRSIVEPGDYILTLETADGILRSYSFRVQKN